MKEHYLIEVTQKQVFYFSVEAENTNEAIELALSHGGELDEVMPPEIEEITAKKLGGD